MKPPVQRLNPVWLVVWIISLVPMTATGQDKGMPESFTYSSGAIVRGIPTEKNIALVFTGDLFGEGLDQISTVLEQHEIRASFFLTGNFYREDRFEVFIDKLLAGGHYLGGHSDRHLLYCDWVKRDSLLVTREQFISDLENNYREMERFGIHKADAQYFLPPYEWYNDSIAAWAHSWGLQLVNYTPGTLSHADYTVPGSAGYRSSADILHSILSYEASAGEGLNGFLLLMHTGSAPERSDRFYPLLGTLVDSLSSRGYQFLTVPELLAPPELIAR